MEQILVEFKNNLPDGVFDKVLIYIKEHYKDVNTIKDARLWIISLIKEGNKFSDIISKGFNWASSPEGHKFWKDIYDNLYEHENHESKNMKTKKQEYYDNLKGLFGFIKLLAGVFIAIIAIELIIIYLIF